MHQDEKQDFNPNDFLIDLNKYTIVKKISENRFSKFELVKRYTKIIFYKHSDFILKVLITRI